MKAGKTTRQILADFSRLENLHKQANGPGPKIILTTAYMAKVRC